MVELCNDIVSKSTQQYVCHICRTQLGSSASLVEHVRGTHLALDKRRFTALITVFDVVCVRALWSET